MTLRTILDLLILGMAASTVTALLVQDVLPLGPLRERIWRRWPYPGMHLPESDGATGSLFGYFWTCYRCAGVWVSAGWWMGWHYAPDGTLLAAAPFAIVAIQRWVNTRIGG